MDLLLDWLTMAARWWHLIAGITWIGASFYFNWFDSLVRPASGAAVMRENNRGVLNEVHGGNFYYHEQYYPDRLPDGLHAHAWPSKMTFLSGLLLLVLVYWLGAASYMVDKQVADITPLAAVAISAASIVLCWLVYDGTCRRCADNRVVWGVMAVVSALAAYGFAHVFGGRAAYISVGVMLGSMMGLNVWLVIAPKSIHMQAQLRSGQGYNREDGDAAKRRSQHNNYFTLPVVLTMVSNHFAAAYSHPQAWVILCLLMFAAWGVRHSLNVWYKKAARPLALYAAVLAAAIAAIALSSLRPAAALASVAQAPTDAAVMAIVHARCTPCHSAAPAQPGFAAAPQGLLLDNAEQVKAAHDKVRQRAIVVGDMPLANLTQMTPVERAQLGAWLNSQKP